MKILLQVNNPQIVCLQETFHGYRPPSPPSQYDAIPANPIIAYDQGIRPSRGVVTLIHNSTPYDPIPLVTRLEAVAIRTQCPNSITVCNIYISPNENIDYRDIQNLTQQLPLPFIFVGDFNAHNIIWGSNNTNNHGLIIENLLTNTDACLLNSGEPTHEHLQTGTSSCIDLCLVSSTLLPIYEWKRIDDLCGSDHYPIMVNEILSEPLDSPRRFLTEKADWHYFTLLTDTDYEHLKDLDIDAMTLQFTNHILLAAENSIPKSSGLVRNKPVPWWNEACREANAARRSALRRYNRTKSLFDKVELKRATAFARFVKRRARKNSWNKFVSSINKDTPMSKIWKRIGKLNRKYPPSRPPSLMTNGILHQDPEIVCNILGEHVANISSNRSYSPMFLPAKARAESNVLNFHTRIQEPYNDPISMNEIQCCLQLTKNTAPGPDEILFAMVKHLANSALEFLLHLFNKIWTTGAFPSQWKEAIVITIRKPGKDPQLPTSYRPIALTCVLCKLLEKVINHRLVHELEKNNHISPNQYGFRKMRGCPDSLARLEADILESLARKQHLVAVFFDIAKAYDTTWRYLILRKIHSLGYRGLICFFVQNFLDNRTFKVRIGNKFSNIYEQQQGVPQGSVMSVTLFALAINDIVSNVPRDICKSLYVDDLAIYYSSHNLNTIERKLQITINRIKQWADQNGFQLSTEKTIAVHFHNKRRMQREISLNLGNHNILFKDNAKFLGLRFDTKLTWQPHITELKAKCTKSLSLLKCLSNTKWGADRQSLLRIYRATTRTKLDYGSQIYGSAKKHILKKLDSVHHAALRLCSGAFRSSPIPSLLVDAGELSLDQRREKLGLQHYLRLQALPDSVAYNTIFDESNDHLYTNENTRAPMGIRMKRLIASLQLPPFNVLPCPPQQEPIWRINDNIVCMELMAIKKSAYSCEQLKTLFIDHADHQHGNSYHIYTDGSCSEEGSGSGIYSDIFSRSVKLANAASSFTSEMSAILEALTHIYNSDYDNITIFTDSRSSIQLVRKITANHPILTEIQSLLVRLGSLGRNIQFCWVPSHVGVIGNEEADRLAGMAARSPAIAEILQIPHKDFYPSIRNSIYENWLSQWSRTPVTNKLRSFRDTTKDWTSSNQKLRKNEVLLTRLRIGHTRLTHGFLMRGERFPPYCDNCIVPLTIKHLLIECPDYQDERLHYFGAGATLNSVLGEPEQGNFSIDNLVNYLTDINIINEI